ncbi:Membrane transport protein mmpL8 [Mycobacterium basiliense]|uniref:Membrane transport protein mmpL8 n=1 Tax=Mycobacterium basiliense TaxID=2094119 RepID=A0A447GAN0_9MYCO|nr:RND family transporter [Mycobacterium basiliense]VDM87520.1 Membrane transport protein mmpL8 [Mycobacterium basiliense]
MSSRHVGASRPIIARIIRKLSVPIILAWLAIVVFLNVAVPPLEVVGQEHSVAPSPSDASSFVAAKHIGKVFKESDSDNVAIIVLEGDQPLGDAAHRYYDRMVRELRADTKHVQHIQDFWGDPLTAEGAQSPDGKSTYVQINLAGGQGEALGNESIQAVRQIVAGTPTPPGVKVFVTGPSALVADMSKSGDQSLARILLLTVVVILAMLLLVYRSIITVVLLLLSVGIEMQAARGVVALLGDHQLFELSTFAVTLLTTISIAAGTDYAIFLVGRYQEARQAGQDPEAAYYTTYRGVAHVILGSGLTVAGALGCLSFTRLPYFQTMGLPTAVGMLVAVAVALTLGPAMLAVGGRFGLFDPKRKLRTRGWRRVGTAVVRWPGPILAAACAVALVGLLALPGYKTSYDDRAYMPTSIPANAGFAAAERHFSPARMKPDILMIETDHDMRNSADFLILDKLAKAIFHVTGISRVQAMTRPNGKPIEHSSIPFQISMQNAGQLQNMKYQRDRMDDMLVQADEMSKSIALLSRTHELMQQMAQVTHKMVSDTAEINQITAELRDHIADFEDTWRPIRSYFYWEKHCYDIPICWSFRSIFDAIDGVDEMSDKLTDMLADLRTMDRLMPEIVAQLPPMIQTMESMRTMMLTMHSTMSGIYDQMDEMSQNATAMGKAFDDARNDDSFYLPPEIFNNSDFKRGMKVFLSDDGKAARFIISHRGDPAAPEGLASIAAVRVAAEEALKGTPLEDAKIYIAGNAATYKDISDTDKYDLLIAGISSLCLIFIIVLLITRGLISALVVVGTVAISLGASFGLSVLIWQNIMRVELHWLVLPMSVIVLLAVGSDYNLLLVSRLKDEISAGLNTGIIRAMGGTGKVVTSAGLVFAATMASMGVSDLRMIGQVGTTIALGLLFDTFVVRAFMTPSIAALLGRWFWWPMQVRTRRSSAVARHKALPESAPLPVLNGHRQEAGVVS